MNFSRDAFSRLVGVGTDDMFLIYSAYRRTKSGDNTAHRLSETFRLCGSGITITSLTNVIAFLAGATTNFYGIRLFCYYTSKEHGSADTSWKVVC